MLTQFRLQIYNFFLTYANFNNFLLKSKKKCDLIAAFPIFIYALCPYSSTPNTL